MAGANETRTTTDWRTESRFYRRPPGLGWLAALLLVPLILGAIGWGVLDRGKKDISAPEVTVSSPTMTLPTAPSIPSGALSFAPLSILRNGNDITLNGELPDLAAKTSLLDSLRGAWGSGVNLIDNLTIKPGVTAPDFAGLGGLFKAAVDVPDFNFKLAGDTLTLTGRAPSENVKAAVEAAAKAAWPNVTINNEIRVEGLTPAPAPPAAGGACDSLQADITNLLKTPINFETDGFTLTPGSQQLLNQVAEKLKACPTANAAVTGYTDNTGNDAINVPLSQNRAKSVADYLTSQGVAGDHVTSQGLGAADPIAPNDTAEGRAQNRRVVIIVS